MKNPLIQKTVIKTEIINNPERIVFKNWFNHDPQKGKEPISSLPSATIPDQTLSVAEIMRRYAHGLPIDGQKVPFYEGEESPFDGVDLKKLDISERYDLMDQARQELDEIKTRLDEPQEKPQKRNKKVKEDTVEDIEPEPDAPAES